VGKHDNPEEVVESAANRLLGKTTESTLPGDVKEESIFQAMKKALKSIPNFRYTKFPEDAMDLEQQGQHPSNQIASQDTSTIHPPLSVEPTVSDIARPSFAGQGRKGLNTIVEPRLSSSGSLMSRTNSGGPVIASPGAGTLVDQPVNGANISQAASMDNSQLAGQKRSYQDVDQSEEREAKRPMTNHPMIQYSAPGGSQEVAERKHAIDNKTPGNGVTGQKRPLDDDDKNEERPNKRLSTGDQVNGQRMQIVEAFQESAVQQYSVANQAHGSQVIGEMQQQNNNTQHIEHTVQAPIVDAQMLGLVTNSTVMAEKPQTAMQADPPAIRL